MCLGLPKSIVFVLVMYLLIPVLAPSWACDPGASVAQLSDSWDQGRLLFYWSVDNESFLAPAMQLFHDLSEADPKHRGRTQTYLGALTSLQAKHASWPHRKLKLVNRGLALVDDGLRTNPDDVESLFIHGATCYYLPFFFGRRSDAERDFDRLTRLLEEQLEDQSPELVRRALDFIIQNPELMQMLEQRVRRLEKRLSAMLVSP